MVSLLINLLKLLAGQQGGKFLMVLISLCTANLVSRVEYESVTFSRMQVTIAERKGYSLARQGRFEEGYLAMDSINDSDRIGIENLSARIFRTKMLLLEVHQLLGS